jgi:hypothetical protein
LTPQDAREDRGRRPVDADGTCLDTAGAIDLELAIGLKNGRRKLTVAAADDQIT